MELRVLAFYKEADCCPGTRLMAIGDWESHIAKLVMSVSNWKNYVVEAVLYKATVLCHRAELMIFIN